MSAGHASVTFICCSTSRRREILDTTDEIAERVRKIGGTTLRSISHISKLQSIEDNDEGFVPAPRC